MLGLFVTNYSLVSFLLTSEILVISLLFLFFCLGLAFNLSYLIGLGLCYLILGGMELALSLLIIIC